MAESISSNEREGYDTQVQWCDLPSPALEMIYSFVSRDDQINMSLVCRKWSEGFYSPSVCKTFRFDMTESQLSIRNSPRMKFVQKCSSMFQHVEVFYKFTREKHLMHTWCRHFQVFLQILASKTQLKSVTFQDVTYCFEHIDYPTKDKICRAIAIFLESQHHLKRVEFHGCHFMSYEGVEILTKLMENSRESLTHLVLLGFVRLNSMGLNAKVDLLTLLGSPRFTTLETEYLPIFVMMSDCQSAAIQTLRKRQMRVPQKIILNYSDYKEKFIAIEELEGLTSIDWRFLKEIYPDLQVEFNFRSRGLSPQKAVFLIMPNMPITRMEFRITYWHIYIIMEFDVLFNHLLECKTNAHLVTFHLQCPFSIPGLASIFIPFLLACDKLKCLELFVKYPVNEINLLMESWLKNRPKSLEKVLIVISDIKDEDGVMNSTIDYANHLHLVGLNVKLHFIKLIALEIF